ncbi:MAG: PAS-domain containing protein [Rhodobacterales bacterium]|nr:PAS-domain containing protein [Rhodobacterales bacterium]
MDIFLTLGLICVAALTAAAAVLALGDGDSDLSLLAADEPPGRALFLFDGERLVDASPGGRALLSRVPVSGGAWARLCAHLAPRFPGVEADLRRIEEIGRLTRNEAGDTRRPHLLTAEWRGGLVRIALTDPVAEGSAPIVDPLLLTAIEDEAALLRRVLAETPLLVWRETAEGAVVWANETYLATARLTRPDEDGDALPWPLPAIFPAGVQPGRARLDLPAGPPRWFDLQIHPDGADGRLIQALPIDATVQAETVLAEFRQTLTKTFAELPVGLAIFDRGRRLALFNPALHDMTLLPVDFLSARPSLGDVFDALRDRRMIPEPKDYRSWRRQLLSLEQKATSGRYDEVWNLPGGRTYRVIGRPHPDGAMALLFQDISPEITRLRRDRADAELAQAVVDQMTEGVAVFSAAGTLVMANAAYAELWGEDPDAQLGQVGFDRMAHKWRQASAPTPLWDRVEALFTRTADRRPVQGTARLADGRLLECRFLPLPGGASLAGFRPAALNQPAAGETRRSA